MTQRKRCLSSGFTLIELIVVITIIGILAGAVVVNYQRHIDNTKIRIALTDIDSISKNAQLFRMEYNRWPDSIDELMNPPISAAHKKQISYFKKMPIDPWDREYSFHIEEGEPFVISLGEDGIEGTEDDITNQEKEST